MKKKERAYHTDFLKWPRKPKGGKFGAANKGRRLKRHEKEAIEKQMKAEGRL